MFLLSMFRIAKQNKNFGGINVKIKTKLAFTMFLFFFYSTGDKISLPQQLIFSIWTSLEQCLNRANNEGKHLMKSLNLNYKIPRMKKDILSLLEIRIFDYRKRNLNG